MEQQEQAEKAAAVSDDALASRRQGGDGFSNA